MCFSATASFVASGVLAAAGVATLKNTKSKREIPLACIPLLFAVQQFLEGMLWLIGEPTDLSSAIATGFLFFAFAVWPIFMPAAVRMIEENPLRRNILSIFLITGTIIGLSFATFLIRLPVSFAISDHRIEYFIDIPRILWTIALYVVVTCGSCMISSHRMIVIFGAAVALSLAITLYYYEATFTSVWCFFAAILSVILYLHFKFRWGSQ
ncbi:MAG: DUF6629 family protein [Patescibacteria group bacterium]|mgnify:CR=1 FL=1